MLRVREGESARKKREVEISAKLLDSLAEH